MPRVIAMLTKKASAQQSCVEWSDSTPMPLERTHYTKHMLFERIESEGLAHFSYLIGHGGEAAVIDPRRDCRIYAEMAARHDMRIKYVLETHRNEDYVSGAVELASASGAEIWHADAQWNYQYGKPARDGQEWRVGVLK